MNLIIDTHSLIWFLFASKKLSGKAKTAILNSQIIYIPTIVLLEAFHVSKKLKFEDQFGKFLSKLPSTGFQTISLDLNVVKIYTKFADELEIHDRVILASAKILDLPIVTKDEKITEVYPKVIW